MTIKTPKLRRHLLRGFVKTRKGSTAIELGFIMLPFLMMTLGTLEIALVHLSRSSVTNAMEITSRQIMTGEASNCKTADEFIAELCEHVKISSGGGCVENTKVVMRELASFDEDVSGDNVPFEDRESSIDVGSGGSKMLLQTYHRWSTMLPLLDKALDGNDGEIILTTNVAFKNEPFSTKPPCPPTT